MSIYRDRCEELEYEIISIKEENEKLRREIESAKEIIENDDNVELIRCKDCTYYDYGTDIGWCEYLDRRMLDCDYCSRARRKDEN